MHIEEEEQEAQKRLSTRSIFTILQPIRGMFPNVYSQAFQNLVIADDA